MNYILSLFSFKGRLARLQYFIQGAIIPLLVPTIIVLITMESTGTKFHPGDSTTGVMAFVTILAMTFIWVSLAAMFKRVADLFETKKVLWFIVFFGMMMVPVVSILASLYLLFAPGMDNQVTIEKN